MGRDGEKKKSETWQLTARTGFKTQIHRNLYSLEGVQLARNRRDEASPATEICYIHAAVTAVDGDRGVHKCPSSSSSSSS